MKHSHQRWGNIITADLIQLFLGRKIGTGSYRDVYEFGLDKDCVVKVECRNHPQGHSTFSNVAEMDIWTNVKGTRWAKWFAPCVFLSGYGLVLIQRRTEPCPIDRLPAKVPSLLADLKPQNWGLYQGNPVVHDYGNHAVFHLATKHAKLVRGSWHDGKGGKLGRR